MHGNVALMPTDMTPLPNNTSSKYECTYFDAEIEK
jgi:hypothetical protein